MKKLFSIISAISAALPLAAYSQQIRSEQELIQLAIEKNICKGREVIAAKYDEQIANRIVVTCGSDVAAMAPSSAGGLGAAAGAALAGLALIAVAAGGGTSSTPSTD